MYPVILQCFEDTKQQGSHQDITPETNTSRSYCFHSPWPNQLSHRPYSPVIGGSHNVRQAPRVQRLDRTCFYAVILSALPRTYVVKQLHRTPTCVFMLHVIDQDRDLQTALFAPSTQVRRNPCPSADDRQR